MYKTTIDKDIFEELLFFSKLDISALAKDIGVSRETLYRYRNNKVVPSIDAATKIAKLFNCRISFLLGHDEDYDRKFGNGEYNFIERFNNTIKLRGVTKYRIAIDIPMPESIMYTWIYKGAMPSLDSIVRLAKYLECSVDYLLGYDSDIL